MIKKKRFGGISFIFDQTLFPDNNGCCYLKNFSIFNLLLFDAVTFILFLQAIASLDNMIDTNKS